MIPLLWTQFCSDHLNVTFQVQVTTTTEYDELGACRVDSESEDPVIRVLLVASDRAAPSRRATFASGTQART